VILPLGTLLTDDEIVQQLQERPELRAQVLAGLPEAEIIGSLARGGRLLLEQPGQPDPTPTAAELAELLSVLSDVARFLGPAHEGRVGFGPVVIVPRTDVEQLRTLQARVRQTLARFS
jgi:hypothetical protein